MTAWSGIELDCAPRFDDAEKLAARIRHALVDETRALVVRYACEAARVRVLKHPLRVGQRRRTAMLVPTKRGFTALVDSALWRDAATSEPGRRHLRFVLAHELGHTLFYRPGSPPTRTGLPGRPEERFCHQFATWLLVPLAAAQRAPLDPEGLYALAGRYDVSLRAAAWAVARARPELTVLWLRRAEHPRRGGEEAMRVQWGASTRFVAVGESFKSKLAALAPGEQGDSRERLRLAGRDYEVDLSAWRFASSMLVVARHHPPADPARNESRRIEQLSLFR